MKRLNFILFFIALLFLQSAALAAEKTMTKQQRSFVNYLLPKIERVNASVLSKRQRLLQLYQQHQAKKPFTEKDSTWLVGMASSYKLKNPDFNNSKTWQALLLRVDTLPPSLILAQAVNESAWGRSRFAKQGNNYFGQWCSKPGCGIIPKRRNPGSIFEVKKFKNPTASITSYIHNLNTHGAYKKLRVIRAQLREKGEKLNAVILAAGLEHYSQRGAAYIVSIRGIINNYGFAQLVQNYQQTV